MTTIFKCREYCASQFDMVNKNDALQRNQWRNLPIESQMAWRIPISMMLDLSLLRQRQPVILVSEYLRLHGLSESVESTRGAWERWLYHSGQYVFAERDVKPDPYPSIFVIHNDWFDNKYIVRVDSMSERIRNHSDWNHKDLDDWRSRSRTLVYDILTKEANKKHILEWSKARKILRRLGLQVDTDDELRIVLEENGWEVIYTYESP